MIYVALITAACLAGSIAAMMFLLMFCYCCDAWSGEEDDEE